MEECIKSEEEGKVFMTFASNFPSTFPAFFVLLSLSLYRAAWSAFLPASDPIIIHLPPQFPTKYYCETVYTILRLRGRLIAQDVVLIPFAHRCSSCQRPTRHGGIKRLAVDRVAGETSRRQCVQRQPQTDRRIAFLPAVGFLQLLKSFGTCQHATITGSATADF